MANYIEALDVSRVFPGADGQDFYALQNIHLQIPEQNLTILKGRSGSGKTTLMNILGALDQPTTGQVFMGGLEVSALGERQREELRRQKMGFVFQSVSLIPIMTAYENVEFALRLAGYQGNHRERAMHCLKLVGLGARMDHMPQEMSGGEQQRVAIARAIAHKPGVIFADEPTAALDTATSMQVMKLFLELVEQEHITIVMTTHDRGLMGLGETVYELQDGRLIKEEHHG
jgi:putative ABC transport system ATP-binding protein